MADSTRVETGAPVNVTERHPAPAEVARRQVMRQEMTAAIHRRGLAAVLRLVGHDASPRFSGPGVAAAHITCQTALVLAAVWQERRELSEREAFTFRILGDLAARARLSEEDAVTSLDVAWDTLLGAARRDARYGAWPARTRKAVVRELQEEAQAFADAASTELRLGHGGHMEFGHDAVAVLFDVLDGRLCGEELVAAVSTVGLDASRPYGLVLLIHPRSKTGPMEAAARAIEDRVARVVDLGLDDGLPVCRHLVFPVLSQAQWMDARTAISGAATKHGVLAVAPAAASSLGDLADLHRVTQRDLGLVMGGCGVSSGIVDPACVPLSGRTEQRQLALAAPVPSAA
jgi:hypothetical protein